MNKFLYLSLFLLSCGTTQQTTAPACPSCPPAGITTVHDTVSIPVPVYIDQFSPVTLNVTVADSTPGSIWLRPSVTGDDYPQLQAAANWQVRHPGTKIILDPWLGYFYLSHPVVWANIINGQYGQVEPDLEGPIPARNTPVSATIKYNPVYGMALGVQQAKGGGFLSLNLIGSYDFPGTLNVQQIDTLAFSEWPDTAGGSSRTSPNAGICIDPFSEPSAYDGIHYKMYPGLESYYLPGMGQGGTTAFNIENCQITNFVVGVMITPSMQANGELINITGNRIDGCKVSVAWSQAQSKANTVSDLMVWGGVHTILDGRNYGFPRGDGSTAPMVDVMNIAGFVHQLIDATASSFPITINRVYGEGLYKVGYIADGAAGIHFDNWQIDFQTDYPGAPSPDFYYYGIGTAWTSCMLRLYGQPTHRIIMNGQNNVFRDGRFGCRPVTATLNPTQLPPIFQHVGLYYEGGTFLNSSTYDSLVYIGTLPITVDRNTFTGYLLTQTAGVSIGDLITTATAFPDYPGIGSQVSPAGFVDSVKSDTLYLSAIGQNLHTGMTGDFFDCKIKKQ